ncbi:MAG TPA: hypothetical protein VGD62_11180, partial [Acidobacteriaceae bacterium]
AIRIFRSSPTPTFVRWAVVVIFCNLWYNVGETDFATLRILWFLMILACIGLQQQAELVRQATPETTVRESPLPRARLLEGLLLPPR